MNLVPPAEPGAERRLLSVRRFHPPLHQEEGIPPALLDEIRLLSRLEHPNVVRTIEIRQGSDGHYLVMEHIDGDSLARLRQQSLRQQSPLPLRVTLRVVLDTLAGLQAVHELAGEDGRPLGLVHRDVSARSVLVGADGVARLTNLGVVRRMGYMAAEHVAGGHVERRADLFAMAALLWECVAHRRLPSSGEDGGAAGAPGPADAAPRLDEICPEVPAAVAAVCARALDPDVARRYPTAADLAEALERAALAGGVLGTNIEVAEHLEAVVAAEQGDRAPRRRQLAAGSDMALAAGDPAPEHAYPARFGKYEVIRHLADGGMAEVYLARASGIEGFEKTVVIKRLKPELAENDWATGLFLQEARIAATLEHPQIAQVYDVGATDGSYFFAMEHVHGQDLRTVMKTAARRRQPLRLEDSLRIVTELCGALHYAHEKRGPHGQPLGLVHRDVSPSNVLLSHDGAVKLCDFGIAEITQARDDATRRVRAGKVSYMSPEQCRGEPLDRRSDIFLLAVVLHELTTLSKLFHGKGDREVMRQIVEGRARRPTEIRADYPPELERIVMKGLSVDPDRRHATALEMRQELEAFARERKMALTAAGLSDLMTDLFPADGADLVLEPETASDFDRAELIELRTPRPWYRAWLAGLVLALVAAAASGPLGRAARAPAGELEAQLQEAGGRIGARLGDRLRAAEVRAAGIAATPMLRAAIATDARTMQDLIAHESLLVPEPGEVFELFQLRGEEVRPLLRVPAGEPAIAPLAAGAARIEIAAGGLSLTTSARLDPLYKEPGVSGALAIRRVVPAAELAAELPDGVAGAVLRSPGGALELGGGVSAGSVVGGGAGAELIAPVALDPALALPALTLAAPAPAAAAAVTWLPAARLGALAAALGFLILFLVGRHRHRWWRRRTPVEPLQEIR